MSPAGVSGWLLDRGAAACYHGFMAEEFAVQGLGDFLEWPPARYMPEGFYEDAGKTVFRRDLLGMYAIKSAFRFRYEGITDELGRAYAAEVERAAATRPAGEAALQESMKGLAERLLQEPYVARLYLYDFFAECAPFVKDARDIEALARHIGYIVERLAMVDALANAGAEGLG